MRGDYYQYTDIGGRQENEDSVCIQTFGNNIVAVVADGLGGQGDGKAASQFVCDSLMHCGEDGRFPTKKSLYDAFAQANMELIQRQKNAFHMKTTAVYFCLQGGQALWGHVGDSRLYHIHEDRIVDYTLDHSASQMAVFLGELRREDIPRDPGRNKLIRAIGVPDMEPDIHMPIRLEMSGQHVFLLCSDGLWEFLSDEDIIQACRENTNSRECTAALRRIKAARSPAGCDNNSAVVVYVKG